MKIKEANIIQFPKKPKSKIDMDNIKIDVQDAFTRQEEIEQFLHDRMEDVKNKIPKKYGIPTLMSQFSKDVGILQAWALALSSAVSGDDYGFYEHEDFLKEYAIDIIDELIDHTLASLKAVTYFENIAEKAPAPQYTRAIISREQYRLKRELEIFDKFENMYGKKI